MKVKDLTEEAKWDADGVGMAKLAREAANMIYDRSEDFMRTKDGETSRLTEILAEQLDVFTDLVDERIQQIFQNERMHKD